MASKGGCVFHHHLLPVARVSSRLMAASMAMGKWCVPGHVALGDATFIA